MEATLEARVEANLERRMQLLESIHQYPGASACELVRICNGQEMIVKKGDFSYLIDNQLVSYVTHGSNNTPWDNLRRKYFPVGEVEELDFFEKMFLEAVAESPGTHQLALARAIGYLVPYYWIATLSKRLHEKGHVTIGPSVPFKQNQRGFYIFDEERLEQAVQKILSDGSIRHEPTKAHIAESYALIYSNPGLTITELQKNLKLNRHPSKTITYLESVGLIIRIKNADGSGNVINLFAKEHLPKPRAVHSPEINE